MIFKIHEISKIMKSCGATHGKETNGKQPELDSNEDRILTYEIFKSKRE